MTLLYPIALLGLLAMLVPILLHLWRKRQTVQEDWAAVDFLIERESHSVRRHTLREWLLLLTRLLLIGALVLALARPVGGLFSFSDDAPRLIYIMLDRSPEMGGGNGQSMLEKGLQQVQAAIADYETPPRVYLIESAHLSITPLLTVDALSDLEVAKLTDVACSIPKMLIKVLQELPPNDQLGKTELWVVSGFQSSAWQLEDTVWSNLKAMPTVGLRHFSVAPRGLYKDLALDLTTTSMRESQVTLDLTITGGTRGQVVSLESETQSYEVTLQGGISEHSLSLDPVDTVYQEGSLRLPDDLNPHNNKIYYAGGPAADYTTLVVTDTKTSTLTQNLLKASALTYRPSQKSRWVSGRDFVLTDLDEVQSVLWASKETSRVARDKLESFLQSGRHAIIFPGSKMEEVSPDWYWSKVVEAGDGSFHSPRHWRSQEGLWRESRSGQALPLDVLKASRIVELNPLPHVSLVDWEGDTPALARVYVGPGRLYLVTTVPEPSWSNMENLGLHLVMIQRLIQESKAERGNGYLEPILVGGERLQAGLGEREGRPVAYNRVPHVVSEEMKASDLKELVSVKESLMRINQFAWIPALLLCSLIFVIIESYLQSYRREGVDA